MNLTISIDKIKSLFEQLKDAADKTDIKYPEGTPQHILDLQKKKIARAAEISEEILSEVEKVALFFNGKDGIEVTNNGLMEELEEKFNTLMQENEQLKLELEKHQNQNSPTNPNENIE